MYPNDAVPLCLECKTMFCISWAGQHFQQLSALRAPQCSSVACAMSLHGNNCRLSILSCKICTWTACDQAAMTAAVHGAAGEVVWSQVEGWTQSPYRRLMASLCSLVTACCRMLLCSAVLSAQACTPCHHCQHNRHFQQSCISQPNLLFG